MPNQETQRRHQILSNAKFWEGLEYELSPCLATSAEPGQRRYWCDGFIPVAIANTRAGAEVTGVAWMGVGTGQWPFDFVVSVPQSILYRPEAAHTIAEVEVDEARKTLRVRMERA